MLDSVVTENAVLFLGSGFSTEAVNRAGRSPPSGLGFRDILAKKLNVRPADYSLADLAEVYAARDPRAFVELIYDLFRTKSISNNQLAILSVPWLRIYTTNFDDVAELGLSKSGIPIRSFSFDDAKPNKLNPGSIVHLHGAVRDIDDDSAISKVVLGEKSYVKQYLEKSHWYTQFLYDLKFADACYFLGYSLADQHISALLMKSPQIKRKTYFIEPDRIPDVVFASRVSAYGEIEPIGLEGFAELVRRRGSPGVVSDFHTLRGFRLFESHPDKKGVTDPTIGEVRDFLTHGKLSQARLMSALPRAIYAMPRAADVERAAVAIQQNRSVIIDARLGNGKTVFQWLLFNRLAQNGYRCVAVKATDAIHPRDIEFLSKQRNLVVFIENYTATQEIIVALSQSLPHAKFVIEVRTSIYEVRLFEIDSKIPIPYARISLNRLSEVDYSDFKEICRASGIAINISALEGQRAELRDLLISVFESQSIREKIRSDLERNFRNSDTKRIIIVSFLLQLVQAPIDPEFLRLVTGVDPFSVLRLDMEGSEEFFSLTEGDIALRSPVFAEFSMREFVSTKDLSDCVHDCAVYCSNRKDTPRFRQMLTSMTQYTRLRDVFASSDDAIVSIKALYERLRWYPTISDEPLFWLQYCILELEEGDLDAAKDLIAFSYVKAALRTGNYQTYQIDTQYLRLLILLMERDGAGLASDTFDDLVKYISVVAGMITTDSHRGYALKVLETVPAMIHKVADALNESEKTALRTMLGQAVGSFSNLSPEFSSESGSHLLIVSFSRAIKALY